MAIANELNTGLYIQTWPHGEQREMILEKTDNKHQLVTIMSVDIPVMNAKWNRGSDHSKWCVSQTGDWTCVADSNRHPKQFERPGGALCIKNPAVADAFRDLKSLTKLSNDDNKGGDGASASKRPKTSGPV